MELGDDGDISRRLVVKDIYLDSVQWNDPTDWHGDIKRRVPIEFHMNYVIYKAFDSVEVPVLQPHAYSVFEEQCLIRLYSEHAEQVRLPVPVTNQH